MHNDRINKIANSFYSGQYDVDCMPVWGHCGDGLGNCHYSVNSLYQEDMVSELVNLWLENECMEWVCDCLDLPYAVCNLGNCNLAYCSEPNPAGCFQTGCSDGYECVQNGDCVASSCYCDELYNSWACTEDCGGGTCVLIGNPGDFNNDSSVDVIDVIILVNHILSPATVELDGADMNEDDSVNILDVIFLVNIILSQ